MGAYSEHFSTDERHGVTFVTTAHEDDSPDLSWLGEWTDLTADEHGCGKRHVRNSHDSRSYAFFCPSFGCTTKTWKETCAENGWTKDEYFAYATSDMNTMRDWHGIGLVCQAETALGIVEASLWGLDANEQSYLRESVLPDLIDECEADLEISLYQRLLGGNAFGAWTDLFRSAA